ncbi:MAG: hypothetical protein IPF82_12600 [Blastocatellia bacterium]|nr:hypothetical protein [Blastocatellia bacterium]
MDPVINHVTVAQLGAFDGKPVVVRSHSPASLVRALAEVRAETGGAPGADPTRIRWVQILSPEADVAPLVEWDSAAPIDIILSAPAEQYTELHKFATLRDRHPIRVTISVVHGFKKAVLVAAALQFSIKLDIGQPDAGLVDELLEVVDLYLHRTTVGEPIEFFHSALLSFFHEEPDSLWRIQEDDPAVFRYVADEADTRQLRRTIGNASADPSAFVDDLGSEILAAGGECVACEFAPMCRGYFKVPDRGYDCAGVRRIFGELATAATQLSADLEVQAEAQERSDAP